MSSSRSSSVCDVLQVAADTTKLSIPYDRGSQVRERQSLSLCSVCGFQFSGGNGASRYQINQHYLNMHHVRLVTVNGTSHESKQMKMYSSIRSAEEFRKTIVSYHVNLDLDFSAWDLPVTKELFAPYVDSFDVTLSARKVEMYLERRFEKMTTGIQDLMRNIMFSVRLDIVSRGNGPYLVAATANFLYNWRIRIIALGTFVFKDQPSLTTCDSRSQILECLAKYELKEQQVYSWTVGYGVDLLNSKEDDDDHIFTSPQNLFGDNIALDCPGRKVKEAVLQTLSSLPELVKIRSELRVLSVNKALYAIKIPPRDNEKRWISTLVMLRRLMAVKERLNKEQANSEIPWGVVEKLVAVLEAIEILSFTFSQINFLLTDFARDYWLCEIRLMQMIENKNEFAATMLASLESCTKDIRSSPKYLAALYADPRFNIIDSPKLKQKEKEIAIDFINKLNQQIMSVESHVKEEPQDPDEGATAAAPKKSRLSPEEILRSAMNVRGYHTTEDDLFSAELRTLSREFALDTDTNVFFYWQIESAKKPLMAKVAAVLFSPSLSQFTTEKMFDCLPMVTRSLSCNEPADYLERRLLVKLNKNLD